MPQDNQPKKTRLDYHRGQSWHPALSYLSGSRTTQKLQLASLAQLHSRFCRSKPHSPSQNLLLGELKQQSHLECPNAKQPPLVTSHAFPQSSSELDYSVVLCSARAHPLPHMQRCEYPLTHKK
ncbi:unnamed protein product, partial [Heterosigma akashiwo]